MLCCIQVGRKVCMNIHMQTRLAVVAAGARQLAGLHSFHTYTNGMLGRLVSQAALHWAPVDLPKCGVLLGCDLPPGIITGRTHVLYRCMRSGWSHTTYSMMCSCNNNAVVTCSPPAPHVLASAVVDVFPCFCLLSLGAVCSGLLC